MGALAWTALNVVLFLLIGYAWMKVFLLLKRQVGAGLGFLFLLSLLAFRNHGETKPPDNLLSSAKPAARMNNWGKLDQVHLSPISQLDILVEGQKSGESMEPYGLYATVSGVLIGHDWKPLMGTTRSRDGQMAYHVVMLHNWKLLGMDVYASGEEYEGTIPVQ